MSTLWAILAVPALPGATYNSEALGLWAIFHVRVCSLAPLPMTRILIYLTPFIPLSFEGEGEGLGRGAPPLLNALAYSHSIVLGGLEVIS
jgi:hypothetical protein